MRKQDNPQFLPALKGEVSLRSLMNRVFMNTLKTAELEASGLRLTNLKLLGS